MIETEATRASASRCPACGQRLDPPGATRCPLCNFDFGDDRVTGADVTPYAKAYAQGDPGWSAMCRWVWFAGSERLKHIALMRTSAAARRFAWTNTLWLAFGLAGFQATRVGWQWVYESPAVHPTGSIRPAGRGWLHLAAAPRPLPPGRELPVDLWWNPAQAVISSVLAGVTALLLVRLFLALIRAGVALAHTAPYRGEQRMTAAILYSSAWWIPALAGIAVCVLRPLSFVGQVTRWASYPSERGLNLTAAAVVGFAATMWWFWLIRLGATAPARTRSRLMAFCTLGIPVLLAAASVAWWFGLDRLHEFLFVRLNMHF